MQRSYAHCIVVSMYVLVSSAKKDVLLLYGCIYCLYGAGKGLCTWTNH